MKSVGCGHGLRHNFDPMTNAPPSARSQLGFVTTALEKFMFLQTLGFTPSIDGDTYVRYEGSRHFIDIYHGRRSYELGVEITMKSDPEVQYQLSTALEVMKLPNRHYNTSGCRYTAQTMQAVREGLELLARDLSLCIENGMLERPDLAASLKRLHIRNEKDYWQALEVEQARSRLDALWKQKAYSQIVPLLESIEKYLTRSERAKLEYAKRKSARRR